MRLKLSKIDFVAKAAIGTALFWLIVILLFSCNTAAKKAQKALVDPKAYDIVKGEVFRLNPCINDTITTVEVINDTAFIVKTIRQIDTLVTDSFIYINNIDTIYKLRTKTINTINTVPDKRGVDDANKLLSAEKESHKQTATALNKAKLTIKNYLIACIFLGIFLLLSLYLNFKRK